MNGAHDMGGMHGFGPVCRAPNEAVFHAEWERRMFGIAAAVPYAVPLGDDHLRRNIERIPAHEYLAVPYYELWFRSISGLLIEQGAITEDELARGTAAFAPLSQDAVRPSGVAQAVRDGASARAEVSDVPQRLAPGDIVRVSNDYPAYHTRVPRYVRGCVGRVMIDHGIFDFPDTKAQDAGACPQHCYSVEFTASEIWGADGDPTSTLAVDLWESHLTPAEETAPC